MRIKYLAWGLCSALMITALGLVIAYVPTEATMGNVQRIFYFHVPIAWITLLSFVVIFVASIMFLRSREEKWDWLARSSGEIGLIFNSLVLITGPIWAKPAWGHWWTWEPRLTSALLLWFIYLAYHLARTLASEEGQGARFAAVVGIAGFVDVPIVALAVVLWGRSNHPSELVFQGGLTGSMMFTLMMSLVAFTALYVLLLVYRTRLHRAEAELAGLKQSLEE